ncbi:MAG: tRNA (guanosine(37)-N1)-methyltransferase TrmD [Firmicutes bacterium HGW-Firmicutes-14]|nr:MAG: tRNA (guanosine(37)-N1)-methyltransferase TrmD [Firmicutes bacterium HGW-Firmicutes-14]
MRIDILTLFPEMFEGVFNESIIKRAREKGLLEVELHNIRDFTHDKHRIVDDYPFGGGAGMVMKPEPVFEAVDFVIRSSVDKPKVILLCPQGRVFNQEITKSLARENHLVLICGHYEGVDERVREKLVDEEISIGDFVLTGGEIPAMAVVDAVARMIPGVLGEEESFKSDSFYDGWLKYPQYTRPREYQGIGVPEVLLSGDHEKIRLWRRKMSLLRTLQKRPELFNRLELSEEDKKLMENEDGGAES